MARPSVLWGLVAGARKRHAWRLPVRSGERPLCQRPVKPGAFPRVPFVPSSELRCKSCLAALERDGSVERREEESKEFVFADLEDNGSNVVDGALYVSDEDFYALTNGYMEPLLEALPQDKAKAVTDAAELLTRFFEAARESGKLGET